MTTDQGSPEPPERGEASTKVEAEEKRSIASEMKAHGNAFMEAVKANDFDFESNSSAAMLHFLARENLGPFYHVKAHLVMSIAELDGESQQVILASARSHLDEAETALKVAKDCYTATDQVLLDDMEKDIRDRRAALEKYEVDVDANEDGGVGL